MLISYCIFEENLLKPVMIQDIRLPYICSNLYTLFKKKIELAGRTATAAYFATPIH